ncbi:hypothetical protein AB6A40_009911 [Gnathostoma spinigerum]|uniref:Uncharacterized protein n=1 Tax=Gnathostoma spinigerum TaxID=75299 RepID=A0ABD6EVS2_9BILA
MINDLSGGIREPTPLPDFAHQTPIRPPIIPPVPPQLHPFGPPKSERANLMAQPSPLPVPPSSTSTTISPVISSATPPPISAVSSVSFSAPPIVPHPSVVSSVPPVPPVPPVPLAPLAPPLPKPNISPQISTTSVPTIPSVPSYHNVSENSKHEEDGKSFAVSGSVGQQQSISVALSNAENNLSQLEEGSSMFGWFQKTLAASEFLNTVADKAKSGMDKVLRTLDPGLDAYLDGDEPVRLFVLSSNTRVVAAITDGFRRLFSTALVQNVKPTDISKSAIEVVGYQSALKKVEEELALFRQKNLVDERTIVVGIQSFIHEIESEWYESSVLACQMQNIQSHVYTQPVVIDPAVIEAIKGRTISEIEFAPWKEWALIR